ncbi:MAG: hypothetical protein ACQERB_03305 [Promethearchaeati archaeon]
MLKKDLKIKIIILMISLLSYIPLIFLLNHLSNLPHLKYLFCDYMISGGSILFPWLSSFKIFEFTSRIGPNVFFSLGNLLDIIIFYNVLFYLNGVIFRFYARIRYPEEPNSLLSDLNFYYYYQPNNETSDIEENMELDFINSQNFDSIFISNNKLLSIHPIRRFKEKTLRKKFKIIGLGSINKLKFSHKISKPFIFSNFIILFQIVFLWLKFSYYYYNKKSYFITIQETKDKLTLTILIIFSRCYLIFILNIKFFSQLSKKYYENHVHTISIDQNELFCDLKKFTIDLCEILFLARNDFFMINRKRIQTINLNNKNKKWMKSLKNDFISC